MKTFIKTLWLSVCSIFFASSAWAQEAPTFPTGMSVVLSDGTVLAVTQDTAAETPTWTDLAGDTTAAKYAERVARKVWSFPVVQPENGLQLSLQAVKLADALPEVDYTRYELSITNPETGADVAIDKVQMMDGVLRCGEISGNTDGSVFVNDTAFLAVEHPMSKMATNVASTLASATWNSATVNNSINNGTHWEIPFTPTAAGTLMVGFKYTSGNHRADIAKVEFVTGSGESEVVHASHEQHGYTGFESKDNIYTLNNVPAEAGKVRVTFRRESENGTGTVNLNTNGVVTIASGVAYWNSDTVNNAINNGTYWDIDYTPTKASDLTVLFQYTSGNHALQIAKVQFVTVNGETVTEYAVDEHAGSAGNNNSDNSYTLKNVPAVVGKVRVTFGGSTGNLSTNGRVTIAPRVTSGYIPVSDTLVAGATFTYSVVEGSVEEASQFRRGFHAYLDAERAHPYRIFPHYNSWYDLGINRNETADWTARMDEEECLTAMQAIRAAMTARGVHLDSYLWDDGWDEWNSLWDFHPGFPNGFSKLAEEAHKDGASISAWLSPSGGYGAAFNGRIAYAKAKNIIDQDASLMQMSKPKYYRAFTDRCLQMIRDYDMNMFKFDRMGSGKDATGASAEHAADMRAVVSMIDELRAEKQDVFINATVGTWASPFWVMWADSIWRGGGDWEALGPGANKREDWITYRDNVIYDRFVSVAPLFPMNSMMLHGIIVGKKGPPAEMQVNTTDAAKTKSFANEVWMGMACGTGLQEYYIDQTIMADNWWNILADGVKWVKANEETLRDTHWVGGDPAKDGAYNVYGYASLGSGKGIIILRNPSAEAQTISVNLADLLEAPEALRTANKPIVVKTVYTSDEENALGGTDFPNFATFGAEAQDLTLEPYGVRLVEILDTNTWALAGEDTKWSNPDNWTTGVVPMGGEVTIPGGSTLTMDVDATVDVLKFSGTGTLTIAGTKTLTVKDFGTENRNAITINEGASLTIDAPETYTPTAPLTYGETILCNGTLTTYGNVKLSKGETKDDTSNRYFGTLVVESGRLEVSGKVEGGLSGTITVKNRATLYSTLTDLPRQDGSIATTLNLYGTLELGGTARWSFYNTVMNLYGGAVIKGAGDAYGTIDWRSEAPQINVLAYEGDNTKTVTIEGALRTGSKLQVAIAAEQTLILDGVKAKQDKQNTMGFDFTGAGTVVLSGENKGTAGITVAAETTLQVASTNALGTNSVTGAGTVDLHLPEGESLNKTFTSSFTGVLKVTSGNYAVTGTGQYPESAEVVVSGENAMLTTSGNASNYTYESAETQMHSLTIEDGATFAMGVRESFKKALVLNTGATLTMASDEHTGGPIFGLINGSSITVNEGTATIRGVENETSATGVLALRDTSVNFVFTVADGASLDVYSKVGKGWTDDTGTQPAGVNKEGLGTITFYNPVYDSAKYTNAFNVNAGRLRLVDAGQPTTGTIVLAAGTTLEWYTDDHQTILNPVTSADATATIEKRGAGTTILECDLTGFSGRLNVIEGILDVGTTRPTISDIGPKGTVRITPTTAELEDGEISFVGLPAAFEGTLEVVGAVGVRVDGNKVVFNVTPVWTYNADTQDATWDTTANWSTGTVPTEGNVIVRLGESGATLAFGSGSFDVVAVEGTGAVTLAEGTTVTVKDLETASTITGLTIAEGAELTIDAIDTYTAEHPLSITTRVICNGTLKTSGNVKLECPHTDVNGNDFNGSVIVESGWLQLRAVHGTGLSGEVTIKDDAKLSALDTDCADESTPITFNVYGELAFGTKRWAMHSATFNLYGGAIVSGDGDDYGAIDIAKDNVTTVNVLANGDEKEVFFSASWRLRHAKGVNVSVPEGMTLNLSGKKRPKADDTTSSTNYAFNFTGLGTTVLSGTNTGSGIITISENATVQIGAAGALGTGNVTGNGTLKLELSATPDTAPAGLTNASNWTGLVELALNIENNKLLPLNNYGNQNSRICITGEASGWLGPAYTCDAEVILDGTLKLLSGSRERAYSIAKLSGSGILTTSGNDGEDTLTFKNAENFKGSINIAQKHCVVIGEGNVTRADNKLFVLSGATVNIESGMVWSATEGMQIDGTVNVAPDMLTTLPELSGTGNLVVTMTEPLSITDQGVKDKLRTISNTIIFKGTDDVGVSLLYPAPPTGLSSKFVFDGGSHTFGYNRQAEEGLFATGLGDENPIVTVQNNANLIFTMRDISGRDGASQDAPAVIAVKSGSMTFREDDGDNTGYFRERVLLSNGTILTIDDDGDDAYFHVYGGVPTTETAAKAQLALAEGKATINGGKINFTKASGTAGAGFDVATGAELTVENILAGADDWSKVGEGTLILTGVNTTSGGLTIAAGTVKLSGAGTLGTSAVTIAEGTKLVFADNTGSAAFANAIDGAGTIEKSGTGFVTFDDTMTIDAGISIDVTGGVLNLGALRPAITSIAEGATVTVTPTAEEITAGKITFGGLADVAGKIEVEGYASPTVNEDGTVSFESTPTWTVQAEGANTWNTQANWGAGKTIPTGGNVKIDIGTSGATLTLDAAVTLGAVEIAGTGKLTIDGTADYPLSMTELTVEETVTEIEIADGADVTLDVSATTSAEVEKVIATKITNKGALTTGGYLTLSNAGNTTSKSLTVASGRLTMAAVGGETQGLSGLIEIANEAEFKPATSWSLSASAQTTIDIYGILNLAGNWTIGNNTTFNAYPNAELTSTGDAYFNGNGGTINVLPSTDVAGVVTISAKHQGNHTYAIADGMTVKIDGAGYAEGSTVTANGAGVLELYQTSASVTDGGAFYSITGTAPVKVTGDFVYGVGVTSNTITSPAIEIEDGANLLIRAWSSSNEASRILSVDSLSVKGGLANDGTLSGARVAATLTVAAKDTLKGDGTISVATTFADGAILDAHEGVLTFATAPVMQGKLIVKVPTTWADAPLVLKGVAKLPGSWDVLVGDETTPSTTVTLVTTEAGLAAAAALPITVNGQAYASMADAVAAAGANGTITITGNCAVAELDVSNGVTLAFANGAVLTVTKLVVGENRTFMGGAGKSHLVVAAGGSVGLIEGATEGSPIEVTWTWADAKNVTIALKPLNYDTENEMYTNGEGGKVSLDAEGNVIFPTSLHGKGAWYEYLFENNLVSTGAQKYTNPENNSSHALKSDATPEYVVDATTGNTSVLISPSPFDDTIVYPTLSDPAEVPDGTPAWSATTFGRMPSNAGGAFVSFGYSYDTAKGTIALVRGYDDVEDQVLLVYIPKKDMSVNPPYTVLAEMTVPNCETTYHLYTFVVWHDKIEIFLDAMPWVTVKGEFLVGGKFQLGKICGGVTEKPTSRFTCKVDGVRDLKLATATSANDDSPPAMDMLRLYNCELTPAEVVRLAEEYPYDSPNKNYVRTLNATTNDWVATDAWTQDDASKTDNPVHGLVTLRAKKDATVTVNLTAGTTLERLTLTGYSSAEQGAITLAAGTGAQALTVTGVTDVQTNANIDCSTVHFAGAVNVATGKTLTLTVPDAVIYDMVHESLRTGEPSKEALTGLILGEGTVTHALTGDMSTEWTLTGGKNANNVYEIELTHNPWYVVLNGETVTWKSGTTLEDAAALDPTNFPNGPKNLAGAEVYISGTGTGTGVTLPGGHTPKVTVSTDATVAMTTTETPTTPIPGMDSITVPATQVDTIEVSDGSTLTLAGGGTETMTFSMPIAGAGALILDKKVTLTNTHTHTGGTTILPSATVTIGSVAALGTRAVENNGIIESSCEDAKLPALSGTGTLKVNTSAYLTGNLTMTGELRFTGGHGLQLETRDAYTIAGPDVVLHAGAVLAVPTTIKAEKTLSVVASDNKAMPTVNSLTFEAGAILDTTVKVINATEVAYPTDAIIHIVIPADAVGTTLVLATADTDIPKANVYLGSFEATPCQFTLAHKTAADGVATAGLYVMKPVIDPTVPEDVPAEERPEEGETLIVVPTVETSGEGTAYKSVTLSTNAQTAIEAAAAEKNVLTITEVKVAPLGGTVAATDVEVTVTAGLAAAEVFTDIVTVTPNADGTTGSAVISYAFGVERMTIATSGDKKYVVLLAHVRNAAYGETSTADFHAQAILGSVDTTNYPHDSNHGLSLETLWDGAYNNKPGYEIIAIPFTSFTLPTGAGGKSHQLLIKVTR